MFCLRFYIAICKIFVCNFVSLAIRNLYDFRLYYLKLGGFRAGLKIFLQYEYF